VGGGAEAGEGGEVTAAELRSADSRGGVQGNALISLLEGEDGFVVGAPMLNESVLVTDNWKALTSLVPEGWRQMAWQSGVVERR
jgi:hypothetical protein